jgi:hypothetical protein
MGGGFVLGTAGDSAAPWIAFGVVLFGAFLGASIMAHKGRSVRWGIAVGLALSIIGDAILLGLPPYAGRNTGWKWDRDRRLRTLFGLLALGCFVMVVAPLIEITTEGSASGQRPSGSTMGAARWNSLSCPQGFDPTKPTPGPHHSNGACAVVLNNGSAYTCGGATVVVARDGSSTASFKDCQREPGIAASQSTTAKAVPYGEGSTQPASSRDLLVPCQAAHERSSPTARYDVRSRVAASCPVRAPPRQFARLEMHTGRGSKGGRPEERDHRL